MCPARSRRKKIFTTLALFYIASALVLAALVYFGLELYLPTPSDEQILTSIRKFNAGQSESLDLAYEQLQVPKRRPGQASVVLYTRDEATQANYAIKYDKRAKEFVVSSQHLYDRGP